MNYIFPDLNGGNPIVNATAELPTFAYSYNVDTKVCIYTIRITDENGNVFTRKFSSIIPTLNTSTLATFAQNELTNYEE